MHCRIWPLSVFTLLCLLLFTISSLANDAVEQAVLGDLEPGDQHGREEKITIEDDTSTKEKPHVVSEAVQEALELLRPLEGVGPGYIRHTKSSGLLENVVHYGKIAFRFLFMNGPSESKLSTARLNPQLAKAIPLLANAAVEQDPDALYLLGEMHLYGNFTSPRDYNAAFDYYDTLATITGNTSAQNKVGFMYATGLGGAERDQARALLFHTFAADQGDTKSEMTVAFRYHSGIGTPRNCDKAAHYYKRVADKAIAYWKSGPPGGRNIPKESYRWADEEGGLYGEGASVSSSGPNANKDHALVEDIMEYLDLQSRQGDLKATFGLGQLYYEGSRTMKKNFRRAQKHFTKVARAYWEKDGSINPNAPKGIENIAGKAAAHIGRMFLRGENMEPSYQKAHMWFKRGVQNGDGLSQYHMGLMYLEGLGVPKDAVRAATYLKAAADKDNAAAQSALGTLFLDQGEVNTANQYFELAARHGYMEAFYYLAELANKGIGRDRHCGVATAYYKIVAEKVESLHSSFAEANAAYENGDTETALILSLMAAEQGYENAQVNVGYLLDSLKSAVDLRDVLNPFSKNKRSAPSSLTKIKPLALIYYTRSAKQSNIDSLLKAGDYYLAGYGVDGSKPDLEAASTCYHTAAEGHHSAQGYWNLGWMHENGIAVSQDFFMAKRFYDLALETNSEAYLPVKLALSRLRIRSWWDRVTGGSASSIHHDEEAFHASKQPPRRTFSEWVKNFWENAYADEFAAVEHDYMEGGPEEIDMDFGAPGDTDNFYEEFDDGIIESLLIIALAGVLAGLVFWRQQRQVQGQRRLREEQLRRTRELAEHGEQAAMQELAREEEQRQQRHPEGAHPAAGEGRGFFPEPGQPEFNQWLAGGVGH